MTEIILADVTIHIDKEIHTNTRGKVEAALRELADHAEMIGL